MPALHLGGFGDPPYEKALVGQHTVPALHLGGVRRPALRKGFAALVGQHTVPALHLGGFGDPPYESPRRAAHRACPAPAAVRVQPSSSASVKRA